MNSQHDHANANESGQPNVCALKVNWLVVEDVLVQLTAVVIDDGGWRLFKTGQKDFKWMSWGSHYFKLIANEQ